MMCQRDDYGSDLKECRHVSDFGIAVALERIFLPMR